MSNNETRSGRILDLQSFLPPHKRFPSKGNGSAVRVKPVAEKSEFDEPFKQLGLASTLDPTPFEVFMAKLASDISSGKRARTFPGKKRSRARAAGIALAAAAAITASSAAAGERPAEKAASLLDSLGNIASAVDGIVRAKKVIDRARDNNDATRILRGAENAARRADRAHREAGEIRGEDHVQRPSGQSGRQVSRQPAPSADGGNSRSRAGDVDPLFDIDVPPFKP